MLLRTLSIHGDANWVQNNESMSEIRFVWTDSSLISPNGCTGSLPSSIHKGPNTYHQRMDLFTGGFRPHYRVYIPSGYDGLTRLPLVVVIYGAFDTAKGMEKFSGFSHLANRENFVALYPEGIGIFGYLQHWNAEHCCEKAADDQIDDVGYLAKAINDVCSQLSIDRNRIYMVGFSNGGMMAYRFVAEHTEMLAPAAPITASIGGRPKADAPEKQLPILIMHGLDDDSFRSSVGSILD
jgi:polyhydroxybutyrate depolymerase